MDAKKLHALRAMHATFMEGLEAADTDDEESLAALDVLTGALVGYVPDLLDEIERLQAGATEPERVRTYKMDRQGGVA